MQIFTFLLIELSGVCTELLKYDTPSHLVFRDLSQKSFASLVINLLLSFLCSRQSFRESWPNEPRTTSDEVKIQVSAITKQLAHAAMNKGLGLA